MTKSTPASVAVGVHEAKTNLSRLLRLVESGAEVEIRRGLEPVARLVPIQASPPVRRLGALRGQIWMSDDLDESADDVTASFYYDNVLPG